VARFLHESRVSLRTVAFTIFIVEKLVSIHEDGQWSGPRAVAWLQLRVIAARLIQSLAQYHPDPELTLNSPSFLNRAQVYQDFDAPYRSFYANAEWLEHIQTDVIPAYHESFPELAIYQLEETIHILLRAENDLAECLSLFSHLLDANTIEQILKLIDLIRHEGPYVQVVLNEKRSGGGMSSNPRPALSSLLEIAVRIVIIVGHRYPTPTSPLSSSLLKPD
jgi:hypothetical protein